MTLTLQPFGELVVHIDDTWNFSNGPISGRSCTSFREVVWDNDAFRARSVWANGSYQTGPEVAEPNIRVLFHADDDTLVYLDYLVRVHLPTHVLPLGAPGKSPALLSGRLEIDESHPDLAWLNRTQVIGDGTLDLTAKTQSYDMYVLRWPGDLGPALDRVMPETDFDVIVVGSGAAGLAAAATAATAGARVLVVESEKRTGGSSRLSDAILQAAGTSIQRASGVDDSPDAMFEYYMTLNRWQVEPGLARAFCDDAPGIVEWLGTIGLEFGAVEFAGNEPIQRGHPTVGMGEALIAALEAECERLGVELALDNRVEELLVDDDGHIAGVRARGEDATAPAVVLAAGGFAHNSELIRRYLGNRMLGGDHPISPAAPGSVGDALVMGEAVGAAIAGRDRAHWVPGPMVPAEVVLLNADGRRFVDESADHSVRTIVANYHGHTYYAIFDEPIRRAGAANAFVARTDAAFLFGDDPLRTDVEPVATWVRDGALAQGATVGDAARGVGLDADAVEAAVERYNDACARGRDEAFEKDITKLVPLQTGPFYAARIQPLMLVATFCGLRIDPGARVLDTAGRAIPGLFAAGESAGGVVGDVYAGHGNSITTALVFGRRAGRNAAARIQSDVAVR